MLVVKKIMIFRYKNKIKFLLFAYCLFNMVILIIDSIDVIYFFEYIIHNQNMKISFSLNYSNTLKHAS